MDLSEFIHLIQNCYKVYMVLCPENGFKKANDRVYSSVIRDSSTPLLVSTYKRKTKRSCKSFKGSRVLEINDDLSQVETRC